MSVQKGDFVELDYAGRLAESGAVFDATSEQIAKKEGIHNERGTYGPRIICVGEHQIVAGLDAFLIGKEEKKDYTVTLHAEQAFGKKDPKLLKIVPSSVFLKQNIKPIPGLRVTINGMLGTIKTGSGGRVIVDFNHPLAGHDVTYHVNIVRVLTTLEEKVGAVTRFFFGQEAMAEVKDGECTVQVKLPAEFHERFALEIQRLIPALKKVRFVDPAEKKEGKSQKEKPDK